jgi:hypothetical protein
MNNISEQHTKMNRFEKMEFLEETTCISKKQFIEEIVSWMSEDDFNAFYQYYCGCWDICESHEELNKRYGE